VVKALLGESRVKVAKKHALMENKDGEHQYAAI
jgi:hypothetical protein